MMASGLPHPQWNSGDVTSADADVKAARDFYGALEVRWGLRVPDSIAWDRGRRIGGRRLMWLAAGALRRARADVEIAAVGPAQLDDVLAVDCAAFGSDPVLWRPWTARLLGADDAIVTYVLSARSAGKGVGSGYCVHAAGSAHVAGVAVLERHRRRGIGAAIASWLLERAFERGATFAHLSLTTSAPRRSIAGSASRRARGSGSGWTSDRIGGRESHGAHRDDRRRHRRADGGTGAAAARLRRRRSTRRRPSSRRSAPASRWARTP